MSITHIINFVDGLKRPRKRRNSKMITLLIGLLGSAIYGWWRQRHGAAPKA